MLSPAQRGLFFRLAHAAWQAHARVQVLDAGNRQAEDDWRHAEMEAACGAASTKDMDHKTDFDRVMLAFAIALGDDGQIAYWTSAAERRMKMLIHERMQWIAAGAVMPVDWFYVRGILKHMNLPELDECPADLLWLVFQALDTHCRRHEWTPSKSSLFRPRDCGCPVPARNRRLRPVAPLGPSGPSGASK